MKVNVTAYCNNHMGYTMILHTIVNYIVFWDSQMEKNGPEILDLLRDERPIQKIESIIIYREWVMTDS